MRFKDFLITLLISTITSLIVIWTLINAGIIPTQREYPQFFIKQTQSDTITSVFDETVKSYVILIEKMPIENVSDKTAMRLLHVSLEAKIVNYDVNGSVSLNLWLMDQPTNRTVAERILIFGYDYELLAIDIGASPIQVLYVYLKVKGNYNFTLNYNLTIVQEVLI